MIRIKHKPRDGGAEKVTYNGIKFKSKLEMFCYKQLESSGLYFEYESKTFLLIDKFKPNIPVYKYSESTKKIEQNFVSIKHTTYTPDFIIKYKKDDNEYIVVECKGIETDNWKMKWKLLRKDIHNTNYPFIKALFVVKNQTQIKESIQLIKELLSH